MKHRHPLLDYHQITSLIFIGTNMCCQGHFNENLLKQGIEVDISLEKEQLDTPFGARFSIWIPVKDHTPPAEDQLAFGVAVIESFAKMKKKMYIHCKNGHGRAPTLVAAYLMKNRGWSAAKALAFLKKQRPSIHLTPNQLHALYRFSQKRKRSRIASKNYKSSQ